MIVAVQCLIAGHIDPAPLLEGRLSFISVVGVSSSVAASLAPAYLALHADMGYPLPFPLQTKDDDVGTGFFLI